MVQNHEKIYLYFFHEEHNNALDLQKETNKILDEGLKLYMEEYPSLNLP
jgi:hypothetical protein